MEKALLKKLMSYSHLRAAFFKDEFKKTAGQYVIPFSFILYFKRRVFPLIIDSCAYDCPYANECDGHRFFKFYRNSVSVSTTRRSRRKMLS